MFVERDDQGKIKGVYAVKQPGVAEEELRDDAPEVLAFIDPPETPVDTIVKIERENPITHRALRELILTIGEAFPAGKNTVFYQRVLETEQAIRAERAKL